MPNDEISTPTPGALPPSVLEDLRFLDTLCTRVWRFQRQLQRLAQKEPSDGLERLQRRFESIVDALRDADLEFTDHDGELYDPGLPHRVLQFEPREELQRETVIETVKPTLRLRGVLSVAEVIVGQPAASPSGAGSVSGEAPEGTS